jgi:hypothetical protein
MGATGVTGGCMPMADWMVAVLRSLVIPALTVDSNMNRVKTVNRSSQPLTTLDCRRCSAPQRVGPFRSEGASIAPESSPVL